MALAVVTASPPRANRDDKTEPNQRDLWPLQLPGVSGGGGGKFTSYPSEWAGLCGSNDEDLKPLGLHRWMDVLR